MNWASKRRLDYIDFRIVTAGAICRSDIMATFGVSTPQASTDIRRFLELYPDTIVYDKTAKRYVPRKGYRTLRGNTPAVVRALTTLRAAAHPFGW